MLSIQPASAPIRRKPRIGLAVAGGGPIGGMYELGALRALDEAIEGLDLTRLEVYVGVSSGAFLSASLANRMNTATMCRIFLTGDSGDVRFRPETFLRPAFFEYARRVVGLPRLLMDWWRSALINPSEIGVGDLIGRFGGLIPNGLFDNSGIEDFLREHGAHVVWDHLLRPGQPRRNWRATLVSDGFIMLRHPDLATTLALADQVGEQVQLHAH
jgi:hypothetical protein